MRHENDLMSGGEADRNLPFLSTGMIRIGKGQSQRVEEHRRRLIKRYSVVVNVGLCLPRIPLIDHQFSLPQGSSRTSPVLCQRQLKKRKGY